MKMAFMTGEQITRDNGSGYRLSDAFPGRRFRASADYVVRYNGVALDNSTVASITLNKKRAR